MIKSLQDLLMDARTGSKIVNVVMDCHADTQQGASPGADSWENLYTGLHNYIYRINIIDIKQYEEYIKKSILWSAPVN